VHRLSALIACAFALTAFASHVALAQPQAPSSKLIITANSASTWNDGKADIIQSEGAVTIDLDNTQLSADQAVVWLTRVPNSLVERYRVEIALLGNARLRQPAENVTRSGPRLFVTATVEGPVRLVVDDRIGQDRSSTPLYVAASRIRAGGGEVQTGPANVVRPAPGAEGEQPGRPSEETGLIVSPGKAGAVHFHAPGNIETPPTSDDTLALAMAGGVTLTQTRANGDFITLQADHVVLFTNVKSSETREIANFASVGDKVTGAYLEGDVRIDYTPTLQTSPEQRLTAERVYYDFQGNRAILTDAVLHTNEPTTKVPVTVRAEKMRQLTAGEYRGEKVELSTSSFATPSFSVRTDKVYVRQSYEPDVNAGGARVGHADFVADDNTMRFFGVPIFYLPHITGTVDEQPFPLRTLEISDTKRFGFGVASEFGLFESLGKERPKGLDISFLADFFSKRGPATGVNAKYDGTLVGQDTPGITNFSGDFKSFIITDHGTDQLGGDRQDVEPDPAIRGRFQWEHQQFFPDHWQAQLRLGYTSDPTFLEEYYPDDFFESLPHNAEAYFKRQEDSEAITLLFTADTTQWVTTSDQQQENFDIEKLPELGYRRIGDSLADDSLTFFSQNTADRLRFALSHKSLVEDQGFGTASGVPTVGGPGIDPPFYAGLPSQGYTGTQSKAVYRGDTRQEIDYPIQVGQIKIVPFVVGRLTGYSDSPAENAKGRAMAEAGVRMTTAFWKVDDSVHSDMFDLYRMRHVIEPEINLFTSAASTDRSNLFIYDEDVDGVSDFSAIQLALHQRFQTKRGGPGRERSVDFFTLNVEGNIFANQPKDGGTGFGPNGTEFSSTKFRGLYFPSAPETSIPRDSINADATWRISDTTAVLSDMQYNVDKGKLATGSIGMAVSRDERLSYFLGLRYVEVLNTDVASFALNYEISQKYSLNFAQSYDFGESKDTTTSITLVRKFDAFFVEATVYHDDSTGESGFRFNLLPEGFQPHGADVLGSAFGNQ
jgi:lipopolysaccharide assembly outer membrane protein LptD (OstA)